MNTKINIRMIIMTLMLVSACLLLTGCWLSFG